MFKNMKIATRFAAASAALCLLTGALAGVGYWQISKLRGNLNDIPELLSVRVTIAEWQGETEVNAARTIAILRSNDSALGDVLASEMKATSARISEMQKRVDGL